MEETHEQHKLHGFMQCLIYVLHCPRSRPCSFYKASPRFWGFFYGALDKLSRIAIYHQLLYSKLANAAADLPGQHRYTPRRKKQDLDP